MNHRLNPLGLTSLEIASNVITGERHPRRPLPPPQTGLTPRGALEQAVAAALARPPCGVSFSGGRDSSAALATAALVARRDGFPLPIPVTLRYPGVPEADETSWQETVIGHLRLPDWERIEIDDELDMVGPVAQRVLDRHGLLWPANTHVHEPVLQRLEGGSLVTGVDGDGLLGGWRWQHQADYLARRKSGRRGEILRVAHAAMPPVLRRLAAAWRPSPRFEWLRPRAMRAVARAQRRHDAAEPFAWGRRVAWYESRRHLQLLDVSFERIAADHHAAVVHFFRDRQFLAQLAAASRFGPGDRTMAMRSLFGDVLPPAVLTRTGKASFGRPFWGPHTRAFLDRWKGQGIDDEVVDVDALKRVWHRAATSDPGRQTALLLQSVWLLSAGERG